MELFFLISWLIFGFIPPIVLSLIGWWRKVGMEDMNPLNTKKYFVAAVVSLIVGWGSCGINTISILMS